MCLTYSAPNVHWTSSGQICQKTFPKWRFRWFTFIISIPNHNCPCWHQEKPVLHQYSVNGKYLCSRRVTAAVSHMTIADDHLVLGDVEGQLTVFQLFGSVLSFANMIKKILLINIWFFSRKKVQVWAEEFCLSKFALKGWYKPQLCSLLVISHVWFDLFCRSSLLSPFSVFVSWEQLWTKQISQSKWLTRSDAGLLQAWIYVI